ncbi:insulinase family protein [Xanthomonas campestris pv. badrii]|uniref:Insulinase family protein n=1 Tax=Xanthomonas campestris pv. badrii TaxID=149696 RepID=A0A7Z2V7S4_XANCA|nr:pitrilysin family protein [Xanthomonas campestris]QJD66649.1 insulinase family protein [Xanthomonas campestris pv. badrii]
MLRHLFLRIAATLAAATLGHAAASATTPAVAPPAARQALHDATIPDLAYQRFTLDNGLTVVVHEDHKAPVVAVSIWYHIGSADEPAGKTGFAHLFEHLMFSGSEHAPGSYFQALEKVGATGINGTTSFDRTNYYETVPTTALDMTLWLESDRMGHLLGAIGQTELDTQRGVVQNEKRQGENSPYGRVGQHILSRVFPANHPYQHDTIGAMADLDAASLRDVRHWFNDNYGAANTTLVLAGDLTVAQARDKAQRYFGHIAAGRAVPRQQPWITPLAVASRGVQHDHVAQPRILRTWVVPQAGSDDALLLDLASSVLGAGKTSRLYQRLVYRDAVADDISTGLTPLQLAGQFSVQADVASGVDPARVEAAIADELRRFLEHGPTADELERTRTDLRATVVRGLEKVGDKAALLADGQIYRNDPGAYQADLRRLQTATATEVRDAARRWLGRSDYLLTVLPAGPGFDAAAEDASLVARPALAGRPPSRTPPAVAFAATASAVDRSTGIPPVEQFPALRFPQLQRGTLRNGVQVILAHRNGVPATQFELLFDGGYAGDRNGTPGTASFAAALMGESTRHHDSLDIARLHQRLGAQTSVQCSLDTCSATLDALNDRLAPSLQLLADIVREPAFDAADIARVRSAWLANIAQEKNQPTAMALRVLPPLLYGTGHPYATPLTGTGQAAAIAALRAADLARFHQQWIRPDNLRILVAGDIGLGQAIALLERSFGTWTPPPTPLGRVVLQQAPAAAAPRMFLLDKPDAPQSLILAGLLAPPSTDAATLALGLANTAFGGAFTSRLNLNLREDKRWAYGAQSFAMDAKGQRPLLIYAPVQTDRTAESVTEILKESIALSTDRPLSDDEVAKVRNQRIRALPGSAETTESVLNAMQAIVQYRRPDDDVQTLKSRLERVDAAAAQRAIAQVVDPRKMTWVIVGDRRKVEAPLRALGLGTLQILDADGRVTD